MHLRIHRSARARRRKQDAGRRGRQIRELATLYRRWNPTVLRYSRRTREGPVASVEPATYIHTYTHFSYRQVARRHGHALSNIPCEEWSVIARHLTRHTCRLSTSMVPWQPVGVAGHLGSWEGHAQEVGNLQRYTISLSPDLNGFLPRSVTVSRRCSVVTLPNA